MCNTGWWLWYFNVNIGRQKLTLLSRQLYTEITEAKAARGGKEKDIL